MFAKNTLLVAASLTVLTSSQGLLVSFSKGSDGYEYDTKTIPLLAEVLKLCISFLLLHRTTSTSKTGKESPTHHNTISLNWKVLALYPIPSLIYLLHNNLQFEVLRYLDPASYQLMGNLKIVTTGVLLHICLSRHLPPLQWMALTLLTVGAATSQLPSASCTSTSGSPILAAPVQGYILGLASAFTSALAAVYTEWLLKKHAKEQSLHWQNCQLYGFGVLFNSLVLLYSSSANSTYSESGNGGLSVTSLVHGFTPTTWAVVANLALSGLLVSWLMRYADSVVKVYATSLSMVLTTAVSIAFLGLIPRLQMGLGIVTASVSCVLYYVPPNKLMALPDPHYPYQLLGDKGGKDKGGHEGKHLLLLPK